MTQNKKIAVTGGIGSGKSAFCNILREKGYPVFSCDEIYRDLWQSATYREGLLRLFPDCATHGEIDKKLLSETVFHDRERLQKLNAYAHPKVMEKLFSAMQGEGLLFAEVPLLFEGGFEELFDGVIAIKRADETRKRAVALRDGLSEEEITARMSNQFDPAKYGEKGCIIIENNGSLSDLSQKAEEAIAKLKRQ